MSPMTLAVRAFVLMAVTFAWAVPSLALDPLTDAEIAKFRAQLVEAHQLSSTFNDTVACYVGEEARLQERNNALELRTGDLRREKDGLESEATRYNEEFRGFLEQYQEIENRRRQLRAEINANRHRLNQARQELELCKSLAGGGLGGVFGFSPLGDLVCDLAGEIAGLNSAIRNAQSHDEALSFRYLSVQTQANAAAANAAIAQRKAQQASTALHENETQIREVEGQLSSVKVALGNVRSARQTHNEVLSEFTFALQQYGDLYPNSDRRIVISKLRRASQRMDEAEQQAKSVLNQGGTTLPTGETVCAL